MKCLKHKKSGVIVRAPNLVAINLLKGGVYVPSSRGAFKRQQKLVARGRISIETVKPGRSLRDRVKQTRSIIRRDRR